MSVKFQITLPEDLASEMKATAARLHIPLAQFIRETVQEKLHALNANREKRLFAWMDDLMIDSPETDLSERVDEVCYGDWNIHGDDGIH